MPRRGGFTLIEAIAVVAIILITTSVAVPALGRLLQSQRITTTHNELLGALHEARSEAITGARPMVVCNGQPSAGCDNDNGWEEGWYIASVPRGASGCVDNDGDQQCDGHSGRILRRDGAIADGVSLNGNGIRLISRVRFNPRGRAEGYAGTLSICDTSDAKVQGSGIVINVSGRMRRAEPGDLNC